MTSRKKEVEDYVDYVVGKLKQGKVFSASSIAMFADSHEIPIADLAERVGKRIKKERISGEKAKNFMKALARIVVMNELATRKEFAKRSAANLEYYAGKIMKGEPIKGTRGKPKNPEKERISSYEYENIMARKKGFRGEGKNPATERRNEFARKKGFLNYEDYKKYSRMARLAGFMKRLMSLGYSPKQAEKIARREVLSKYKKYYLTEKRIEQARQVAEKSVEIEKKGLLLPAPKNAKKKKKEKQYAKRLR